MRYLILVVPFLIASNWLSVTDLGKAKIGQSTTTYTSQKSCEKNNPGVCWQIDGCEPIYCTIQPRQVDDFDKPIFGPKTKKLDCQNPQVCQALQDSCSGNPEVCIPYCDDILDGEFKFEQKPGQPIMYQVFCRKFLGHQKKTIQVLAEKAALKIAFEQAENQKAIDRAARENRRGIARSKIKTFDPSDDSPANRKKARELLKDLLE